jgi:threonine aldolase
MYGSDNQAPVHPAVMAALAAANDGAMPSYGADPWTIRAEALARQLFETEDLDIVFVATGGAANGLALSVLCPAWAAVLAHGDAHIIADEGAGPEFFTGGARMIGLAADAPRLTSEHLRAAASHYTKAFVHGPQPRAVSITNLAENGLAWRPAQIAALAEVCKAEGWGLHMDGARFANAVAGTGARPAELTWRAGVDALSFGLTKNGAMACEAVVLFGKARSEAMPYLRKRAGQLFSKHRYLSAQFVAMVEDGLWLRLAEGANASARALAETLVADGATLLHAVDGNEVFARLSDAHQARLSAEGIGFFPWAAMGEGACRFVARWS